MKYLMFVLLSLFAGLFIHDEDNGDFDKLWKQVEKEERKLPKTAYAIVEQIYDKALSESRDDQLIKAIIYKAKLSKQFEDKDPADAIKSLEAELAKIKSNSAKAVYCSLLGGAYSQYGMNNSYRFQQRTREEEGSASSEDLPFQSLEEVQKISVDYYKQSLSYTVDTELEGLSVLIQDNKETASIRATTLEQFLLFRALEHFRNTQSLVSLPTESLVLNSPDLFDFNYEPAEKELAELPANDYVQLGMVLFQKARSLKSLSSDQQIWLELIRLEYLNRYATVSDKEKLYEASLIALGKRFEGQKGYEAVYCKLISSYLELGGMSRHNNASEFKGYYPKAASLLDELESSSKDAYYKPFISSLRTRLSKVEFDVQLEKVNVKEKPFLALLKYRNVTELDYAIYRLEDGDFKRYNSTHKPQEKIKFVKSLKSAAADRLKLQKGSDFEFHSIEFPVSGLSAGRYVMLIKHELTHKKDSATGVTLSLFHVSNLSYVSMNGWDNSEGFVVDRTTGEPLENVEIIVSTQRYDQGSRRNVWTKISTLTSDTNGRFQYSGEGRNFSYKLVHGDDYLELGENHYFNKPQEPRSSYQVQLFTDRAIYRPGQTIYYKGLVIEKDKNQLPSIVSGKEVKVIFRDANWQVIKEEGLSSDEFGTFHGILTAPEGSLTGRMQIEAKVDNRSFQQAVRVEEYKRPKLYAKIDKIAEPYALGDTVTISGSLLSFSGAVISAAKVKYRIEKKAARRWFSYYHRGGQQNKALEQVSSGLTKISEDGSFKIVFPTKLGSDKYSRYNYVIHFDFTDETGESTTIKKSVVLSSTPFYLSIDMQESCFEEELKDIELKALNAENEEVEVSYKVKVSRLTAPISIKRAKYWKTPELDYLTKEVYEKQFPYDSYKDAGDPSKWKVEKVIIESNGSAQKSIDTKSLRQGAYKVELTATDTKGNELTEERYLFVSADKAPALPTKHLWTSMLKESYEPNDLLKLKVTTPYTQAKLLYRLRRAHDNKLTEWKDLSSGAEITYPITESDRGGFTIDIIMVKNNRVYTEKRDVSVPWTNKALDVEYVTFRDKLTPGIDETWKLKIKDAKGLGVEAELLAAMYDASLDQFVPHKWMQQFYPTHFAYGDWNGKGFGMARSYAFMTHKRFEHFHIRGFQPQLNMFGYNQGGGRGGWIEEQEFATVSALGGKEQRQMKRSMPAPVMAGSAPEGAVADAVFSPQNVDEESMDAITVEQSSPDQAFDEMSIRENLNETVFFYPDLKVENGEVELSFKMNEALTKWKLLLFGHTKELEYVFDTKEIVTQKQLMIEPHMPRFVRQGDKIYINAKVSNLSGKTVEANSRIQITAVSTGEELTQVLLGRSQAVQQSLEAGKSSTVEWIFDIPKDLTSALIIKMITEGGGHSDGEQNVIPVLSNRKLVTETMPMHIPGGSMQVFEMTGMENMAASETLDNHNFTVELTTNPAWIIAKAIPFLTTRPKPSSEALLNTVYGNLLMQDVLAKNVEIKKVIETWKAKDLQSPLSKNQDLKLNALEETPWVRAAQSEEEQMAQLSVFLDNNYVNSQISSATAKLKQRQLGNGGFSWMPGGRDNWYVTQNILEGIGKLNKMGIANNFDVGITDAAVKYIDERMAEIYDDHHSKRGSHIEALAIHYLYVRSFFPDKEMTKKSKKVVDFYFEKGKKYWDKQGSFQQGLLALAAARLDRNDLAEDIIASLRERMIKNDELGYYWNDQAGYYWYNLDIEKQALMIELFNELQGSQAEVDGLKLWLLKAKQTNSWKTSKATSAACYAFLLGSDKWLQTGEQVALSFPLEKKDIALGDQEYATGYVRKDYAPEAITTTKKQIQVTNPNKGVVWGAAYWQYFEDLDKIENFQETPLKLVKEVYKVGVDNGGEILQKISTENSIVPGDRLRIKISLQVDRPMEFIEMKDMRSSGLEPMNVLSSYKWQDGLSYYESTKDLATYFYFDLLPKGNWSFEYDVKAAHKGHFSNGITEIQAMYAPEFSSHSNGVEITVTKE